MPPKKKFRSGRSKKWRFTGNRYTVKEKKANNEASIGHESVKEQKQSSSTDTTKVKSLPVSVRKLDEISNESHNSSSEEYS